ncbi:unnamed protein product [Orchesella dallaii]|uniref:Uncharacterized protein n=1 Tax=Orchesella dallaii TaxID=48710 RepID=A0ABP1S854_9HEXA
MVLLAFFNFSRFRVTRRPKRLVIRRNYAPAQELEIYTVVPREPPKNFRKLTQITPVSALPTFVEMENVGNKTTVQVITRPDFKMFYESPPTKIRKVNDELPPPVIRPSSPSISEIIETLGLN